MTEPGGARAAPQWAPVGCFDARLFVGANVIAGLFVSLAPHSDAFAVLGFLMGLVLWALLYRVATRAAPNRDFMGTVSMGFRMTFSPSWWHEVLAPATRWPVLLVEALLVCSLVVPLIVYAGII